MITFNFPKLLGLSLAGLCPLFSGCEEKDKKTSESEEPNIIFIMVDDMGYGDAECYNPDSKIPTPHINSLADEGMQFTNAHAPGSWSIPTRYGLLTGRYPDGARSYVPLEENQITIADLLNDNGYHTGMVGKWHLGFENDDNRDYSQPLRGGPIDHGFEYYFGIPWSLDISPYFYIENDTCVQPPTDSIEANHSKGYYPIQGEFWRKDCS